MNGTAIVKLFKPGSIVLRTKKGTGRHRASPWPHYPYKLRSFDPEFYDKITIQDSTWVLSNTVISVPVSIFNTSQERFKYRL